jgi:hypothetical protein
MEFTLSEELHSWAARGREAKTTMCQADCISEMIKFKVERQIGREGDSLITYYLQSSEWPPLPWLLSQVGAGSFNFNLL